MKKDKNTRMTGGMLALYLLLTLVMGTAIVVGIVRTQTEEVEGKTKDGVVSKTWREWGAPREKQFDRVDTARRGDILSSDGKILSTTVIKCKLYLDLGIKYETDAHGKKKFVGAITDSLLYASLDTMAQMVYEAVGGPHNKQYYVDLVTKERKSSKPRQCFRVVEEKIPYSVWLAITRLPGWKNCVVREVDGQSVKYEVRSHIYDQMARNTVGLEIREGTGKFNGLEGAYDSILKGRNGVYSRRRLTRGVWLPEIPEEGTSVERRTDGDSVQKVVSEKRIDGQSIVATIDTRIQDVAEDALRQTLYKYQGLGGCAVVMEVKTGYVVACANLAITVDTGGNPVLDGNGKYTYSERRDWNTAVSRRYNPGSTMKTVALTAMLNDPKITIDTTMRVISVYKVFPGKEVTDSHKKRDSLSVREVIEESSNVGMAELGWMYYRDRRNDLVKLMRQVFPYDKLHLDLMTGEPEATINDVTRSNSDLLTLTYGYATEVTPMQIITFYNALAGDGRMLKPLFCRAIIDRQGNRTDIQPVVLKEHAFSPESAQIMREMLAGVVDHGTAKSIKSDVYHIAGKTGTADYHISGVGYTKAFNNSSFAGFFPAESPRYTCYVMLEKVPHEAFGTQAAKVFKMISDCVMAIDERLSVDMAALTPVDSTKTGQRPVLQRGNQQEIAQVYGLIGRNYMTTNSNSQWVTYNSATASYQPETPVQGRMPNCQGMTAKDAIALLHSVGLKVRVKGYGKVVSQSLKAGTAVSKGTVVEINLK